MKGKIEFEADGIEMPDFDKRKVSEWIRSVARDHGYDIKRLSYLFLNDEKMLEANNKYLGHDYYTDVITFDYTRPEILCGEILISLDTVKSNAELMDEEYGRELLRVVIHGVLHLCGINDKGEGEREIMEAEENKALRKWEGELSAGYKN